MQKWCKDNGFPEIITVRKGGNGETLEEECLRLKTLPSIAYGFKTCSQKYKISPQEIFFNNLPEAKSLWESNRKIRRAIGFDYDEPYRVKEFDGTRCSENGVIYVDRY